MHSMQSEIINKLLVQPKINPEVEFRRSVDMLKEYAKKYSFIKSFVLGISGGQGFFFMRLYRANGCE